VRIPKYHSLVSIGMLAACCAGANAATITAGTTTTVASGAIAPGSANDYTFFGAGNGAGAPGNQPTDLTNFTAVDAPGANEYGNTPRNYPWPSYSSVTAPGGSSAFVTGIVQTAPGYSEYENLAILTLGAGGPSSFTFNVLFGNTDRNGPGDASISLSSDGGAAVTADVTEPTTPTNDFVSFFVTDAVAGDTFTFGATSLFNNPTDPGAPANPYIGGITVSDEVFSAPEPSSLALLSVGLGGVFLRRRRNG